MGDAEVVTEANDFFGISDEGFDLHLAATLGTHQRVDFENPLHAGCPGFGWLGSWLFPEWGQGDSEILVSIFR